MLIHVIAASATPSTATRKRILSDVFPSRYTFCALPADVYLATPAESVYQLLLNEAMFKVETPENPAVLPMEWVLTVENRDGGSTAPPAKIDPSSEMVVEEF